jgi:hypothetical protein
VLVAVEEDVKFVHVENLEDWRFVRNLELAECLDSHPSSQHALVVSFYLHPSLNSYFRIFYGEIGFV